MNLLNSSKSLSVVATAIGTIAALGLGNSPAQAANFSLEGSNDVRFTNFNGNSQVAITGTQLGITSTEELDALSGGTEPLKDELWDILFTVDRPSVGQAGSSVNFFQPNSPADIFFTNPALQGTNRLLARENQIGISPTANIDALEIFGVDESTTTNLRPGDAVYFGVESSEIFFSTGNNTRITYADTLDLGLDSADIIDAIAVFDTATIGDLDTEDVALFSLAPGSPTLNNFGFNPGDVLFTRFDSTTPSIAGPNNINFPFALTAENLGLLPGDNLNGLDVVRTSTGFDIPQDPDFPVDRAVANVPEPLTILGSATALGFGALLKREHSKKQKKS